MSLSSFLALTQIGAAAAGLTGTPRRAIVIIDVTNEQFGWHNVNVSVWHNESVLEKIEWLVSGRPDAPVWDAIFTCQNWIYSPEDSTIASHGWKGGVPGSVDADLVPPLAKLRDAANQSALYWRFVGKPNYSCFFNTAFEHSLLSLKIDELYMVGINTEQCVFSTAFDAWRLGPVESFFVVSDATSSGNGKKGHLLGLDMVHATTSCSESKPASDCHAIVNSSDIKLRPSPHTIV
jgi:nicotinamidase-related amidase